MAQNYYFFKTVKVGGRQRLRPLPGQKEPSGRHIDESLNSEKSDRLCFALDSLESGQNLFPLPPAIITTESFITLSRKCLRFF